MAETLCAFPRLQTADWQSPVLETQIVFDRRATRGWLFFACFGFIASYNLPLLSTPASREGARPLCASFPPSGVSLLSKASVRRWIGPPLPRDVLLLISASRSTGYASDSIGARI